MRIKAVMFDIDGTLIDSNDAHIAIWDEVFRSHGFLFNRAAIHDQIGKGGDILVPSLIPGADKTMVRTLGEQHGEFFKKQHLHKMLPFPKARELLLRVQEAGQKIVFASSASQDDLDHYLGVLDARKIVSATTSADEVENTKPEPDIFAAALAKVVPLQAGEVMVVGDTPYDVEAAAKCGIRTIALRSGCFPDDTLLESGAIALYDDVAALLADYANSPLAR